jgi:NAD(P)-dependent dehydrogenase (short-subunit alcohol dehydrogenase family)
VVFIASVAAQLWFGPNDKGMADFVPLTLFYHPYNTYGLSKALNVLTAKEQQRHWGPGATAITVAAHPGIIATDLLIHNGKGEYPIEGALFGWPFSYGQKSVAQGASTIMHAALAPHVVAEVRSGIYFYSNNAASETWNPEYFTDAVGKDTWTRSAALPTL